MKDKGTEGLRDSGLMTRWRCAIVAWWSKPVTVARIVPQEHDGAGKIAELRAEIEALEQERALAANAAAQWMERAKQLEEQKRVTAAGLSADDAARLAVLADHAGRAAMLAGRVLRYGWDQRRDPDSPALRELLLREAGSLIAIAKQIAGLRAPKGAELN